MRNDVDWINVRCQDQKSFFPLAYTLDDLLDPTFNLARFGGLFDGFVQLL